MKRADWRSRGAPLRVLHCTEECTEPGNQLQMGQNTRTLHQTNLMPLTEEGLQLTWRKPWTPK
jgi:hypothetical protein